jgi:hypothetical protein
MLSLSRFKTASRVLQVNKVWRLCGIANSRVRCDKELAAGRSEDVAGIIQTFDVTNELLPNLFRIANNRFLEKICPFLETIVDP